jgi:hypothetical protein
VIVPNENLPRYLEGEFSRNNRARVLASRSLMFGSAIAFLAHHNFRPLFRDIESVSPAFAARLQFF